MNRIKLVALLFLLFGMVRCESEGVVTKSFFKEKSKINQQLQVDTSIDVLDNLNSQISAQYELISNYQVQDSLGDLIILTHIDSLRVKSNQFHNNIAAKKGRLVLNDSQIAKDFLSYLNQYIGNERSIYLLRAERLQLSDQIFKGNDLALYVTNIMLLEYDVLKGLKYSLGGNRNCFNFSEVRGAD